MTVNQIMTELQSMGSDSIRKILLKHGVKEPLFGVKIEHLKTIEKKVKKDYQLAKDLYATGNADAMYLAGLIADAIAAAKHIAAFSDTNGTVFKVPDAAAAIEKAKDKGVLGKKKKTVKC